MFEKIRKMKNQKGFTLVELIVVLVILAILAAMLVPALTGYIKKANDEKIKAVTRQVVMAAQAEVSEAYSEGTMTGATVTITATQAASDAEQGKTASVTGEAIVKLAEVGEYKNSQYTLNNGIKSIVIKYNEDGVVESVVVTQGSKTCTYNHGQEKYTMGTV